MGASCLVSEAIAFCFVGKTNRIKKKKKPEYSFKNQLIFHQVPWSNPGGLVLLISKDTL